MASEEGKGIVILFWLGDGAPWRGTRLAERVWGQKRKVGGHEYQRRGMLTGVPHWKVTRGALVVRREDGPRVVREIRRWAKGVVWWPVPLTQGQLRELRKGAR